MDEIEYVLKEKARLLKKYNCNTILEVLQYQERILNKNTWSQLHHATRCLMGGAIRTLLALSFLEHFLSLQWFFVAPFYLTSGQILSSSLSILSS